MRACKPKGGNPLCESVSGWVGVPLRRNNVCGCVSGDMNGCMGGGMSECKGGCIGGSRDGCCGGMGRGMGECMGSA